MMGILAIGMAMAEPVEVYLLGGQSNMQGIGKLSQLPDGALRATPNVYFFNGESFDALKPGETKTSARAGELGPELGFAMNHQSEQPVYLIKFAASGMPLDFGWNGNQWLGAADGKARVNFYPGSKASDPVQGRLYKRMLNQFQKGIAAIKAKGDTPVIKGFLWMQGEQDSKNEASAGRYAANLKLLQARLSEDLAVERLPMVYGQVLPHEPALPRFTHRTVIRDQMAAGDAGSGRPEAIVNAAMVSTDGFPILKDTVHYDAEGQLMLGKAMAEKMAMLQNFGEKVELWSGQVPGFPADYQHQAHTQQDPEHITEVSKPFLRVFPAMGRPTGQAIIIFPGGGYRVLADLKEGDRVGAYYAARGITCFVVRYRVTRGNHPGFRFPGPLLDARQGIRLAKQSAEKFGFDPKKVGVIGFSAGGHLASMCATLFDEKFEGEPDSDISPRPAFAGLIYPVTSLISKTGHGGSRVALMGKSATEKELQAVSPELQIKSGYPPLFLAQTQFDFVNSNDTLTLAQAAMAAKVPCETHIFPGKDHGFGMGRKGSTGPETTWPELFEAFLKRLP